MSKKSLVLFVAFLGLAACAPSQPRIIQASSSSPQIVLRPGMVTQIEMPDGGNVQSITIGNPDLISADKSADVVNLMAKGAQGETNLIIRSNTQGDHASVYQYHILVQPN